MTSEWRETILPSDGKSISIRRLGLFEIEDNITLPSTRPYTVRVWVGGTEYEQEFSIHAFSEPPKKPGVPVEEVDEGTPVFWAWKTYLQYQEALLYQKRQERSMVRFRSDVARYIRSTCILTEDQYRIESVEDWREVTRLALVPKVSLTDLQLACGQVARVTYDDEDVLIKLLFDPKESDPEGGAKYAIPTVWEVQTISEQGWLEEDWAKLSVQERARKIVGHKLSDWLEALESQKLRKEQSQKQHSRS